MAKVKTSKDYLQSKQSWKHLLWHCALNQRSRKT